MCIYGCILCLVGKNSCLEKFRTRKQNQRYILKIAQMRENVWDPASTNQAYAILSNGLDEKITTVAQALEVFNWCRDVRLQHLGATPSLLPPSASQCMRCSFFLFVHNAL